MAYPKPLSEKSLAKLYKDSGISEKSREYLHAFFAACANLYGFVTLNDAWEIHSLLLTLRPAPKLRKKDMIAFSSIVRREEQPYRVYEIDELHPQEPRDDRFRVVLNNELIGYGYRRYAPFYILEEERAYFYSDYRLLKEFLSYAVPVPTPEETALLSFLGELKTTADECVSTHRGSVPNVNKGKKLKDFSFFNANERYELDHWLKRPNERKRFLEEAGLPFSEKLVRRFKRDGFVNGLDFEYKLDAMTEELLEVGVVMTKSQTTKLSRLASKFHSSSRMWSLSGWTPRELSEFARNDNLTRKKIDVTFCPELKKAFDEGMFDKELFFEELRKFGINPIE